MNKGVLFLILAFIFCLKVTAKSNVSVEDSVEKIIPGIDLYVGDSSYLTNMMFRIVHGVPKDDVIVRYDTNRNQNVVVALGVITHRDDDEILLQSEFMIMEADNKIVEKHVLRCTCPKKSGNMARAATGAMFLECCRNIAKQLDGTTEIVSSSPNFKYRGHTGSDAVEEIEKAWKSVVSSADGNNCLMVQLKKKGLYRRFSYTPLLVKGLMNHVVSIIESDRFVDY